MAVTGGFGLFAGFAGALGQAKKQDPAGFDKGLAGAAGDPAVEAATRDAVRRLDSAALEQLRSEAALHESGAALARRALGWGTLWAVAGCGAIFLSVWSLMGVSSLAEVQTLDWSHLEVRSLNMYTFHQSPSLGGCEHHSAGLGLHRHSQPGVWGHGRQVSSLTCQDILNLWYWSWLILQGVF